MAFWLYCRLFSQTIQTVSSCHLKCRMTFKIQKLKYRYISKWSAFHMKPFIYFAILDMCVLSYCSHVLLAPCCTYDPVFITTIIFSSVLYNVVPSDPAHLNQPIQQCKDPRNHQSLTVMNKNVQYFICGCVIIVSVQWANSFRQFRWDWTTGASDSNDALTRQLKLKPNLTW